MHKEIVVNVTPNEVRVGLMEDHLLVEVLVERADSRRIVGNVYKGLVTAVRPGLQAAFIDIGLEKAGFLHVSDLIHDESQEEDSPSPTGGREREGRNGPRGGSPRRGRMRGRENLRSIETMLREGDELLVQVTKEVIGTKGPRLTADLSLPGRFLVMMPKGSHVGVSRKIEDRSERARLREMLSAMKPDGPGAYIIRTAGVGVTEKMLQRDVEYLSGLWEKIGENANLQKAPSLVHEDVGLIVGLVRDILKDDVNALHVDDKEEYERLLRYIRQFSPELKSRVQLYRGNAAIFDAFGIEAELKKSLDKKVWLNRGGCLVIEQTEALVAIDVNTGRFTGKRNQEETILRANMMAAREIPRQLRLRDIGGIIVIDFIDMENEADKRKVLAELRTHLRHDRARTKTFAVSDLGLVEMSRQRVRQSVRDILSDECPYCRATGKVLSIETLANKVQRMLEKVPLICKDRAVQVQAGPPLALELMLERSESIAEIARSAGIKINVIDDPRLHREEFRIVALQSRRDLVSELEDSGKPARVARSDGRERSEVQEPMERPERPDRARRGEGDRAQRGERHRRGPEAPLRGPREDADLQADEGMSESRPASPRRDAPRGQDRPAMGFEGRGRSRARGPAPAAAEPRPLVERVLNPLDGLREDQREDFRPVSPGAEDAMEAPERRRRRRGGRGRRRRHAEDAPMGAAGMPRENRADETDAPWRQEVPDRAVPREPLAEERFALVERPMAAEADLPHGEERPLHRRSRRSRGGRPREDAAMGPVADQDSRSATPSEPVFQRELPSPIEPRSLATSRPLPEEREYPASPPSFEAADVAAGVTGERRPRRRARRARRRGQASGSTGGEGGDGEGGGGVAVAASAESGSVD